MLIRRNWGGMEVERQLAFGHLGWTKKVLDAELLTARELHDRGGGGGSHGVDVGDGIRLREDRRITGLAGWV